MERQLHGDAELTITGFLIGFAIAQLVWGPISDRIGRKLPLFIGMALFVVGSIGCAMSQSMSEVIIWRIFQATGACVGPMLSRAMISDVFENSEAAKMLSNLVIIMAAAPIIGPLLGGALLEIGLWHWIFWLMAAASAFLFILIFFLPETLPQQKRSKEPMINSFKSYFVLIKDAKFVAFDKTGTLSKGLISVKSSNLSEKELELVASAENLSEHPISKAIVRYAKQNYINLQKLNGKFQNVVGQGIVYEDESNKIIIGNEKLLAANDILLNEADSLAIKEATNDGSGVILCAVNQKFSGFLTLSDELKNEANSVINELAKLNLQSVILSGDDKKVVANIASKLNVSEYYANMLPEDKFNKVKELMSRGGVIFVGDGINDSPSLKEASVGIAMNSGSDIAKGAGDIVLVKNDLRGVSGLVKLANATIANIKENLFWAFMYNAICIPVAAGVLYPVFGLLLSPVYGSMAMCLSSVTVVLNALRLRYLKLKD